MAQVHSQSAHQAREGAIETSLSPSRVSGSRILRLPIIAAVIVFGVAIVSTQIALTFENREADRQTERLAKVYLDGLEAATRDAVARRDWREVEMFFRSAFQSQEGLTEVTLLLTDRQGTPLATVKGAGARAEAQPPADLASFAIVASTGLAWAARPLSGSDGLSLVAALDVSDILAARARLFWSVAALDLLIAVFCGYLAYLVLQRLSRPVDALLALLRDNPAAPAPVSPGLIEKAGPELRPVFSAYNNMVEAFRERERLRAEISERSHAAALGRLAATIAHEVRNPLGGLSTAISTLRKFGDRPEVRAESLDFLARGIDSIDALVTRTLNVYRPEDERRLSRVDFDDLRMLVLPAAEKREVEIVFAMDLPESFEITASGMRQVLLNLLLNAIAVSPQAGCVRLDAHLSETDLVCVVSDEGPGMDHRNVRKLLRLEPDPTPSRRLGLDAVISILGDLDARVSVKATEGGGSTIQIDVPLARTA